MAKNLLFLIASLLFGAMTFGQATAYPPGDLVQCGSEVFNLTATAAQALGNQSPATHSVSWHLTMSDAQTGLNPISAPTVFIGLNGQTIYVRVRNNSDMSFDVASFSLEIVDINLAPMANVTACGSYTLPPLPVGNYYTQPGGNGNILPPGTTFTATTSIYVYAADGMCSEESSFTIVVFPVPQAVSLPNVTSCNSYTLPPLPANMFYSTSADGSGTSLLPGTVISESMTLYVVAQIEMCIDIESFQITILPIQELELDDVQSCTPYALPELPVGLIYYVPDFTPIPAGSLIYYSQPVYVTSSNGICEAFGMFNVTIGDTAYEAETLSACVMNGVATFDFNVVFDEIAAINPDAVATIYESMADATAQANQFLPLYSTPLTWQTVYLRIDNVQTGCFSIQPLLLQSFACTNSSISGVVRFDQNGNGCDGSDNGIEGVQVICTNENNMFYAYTNASGEYSFEDVYIGTNVIAVTTSTLPAGAVLSGNAEQVVDISGNDQEFDADFCVDDISNIVEAGAFFYAQTGAVPGFVATYVIQVRNFGASPISGSATLTYDDLKLDFSQSTPAPTSQSSGNLGFDFTDVPAFGYKSIVVKFMVAVPPIVNSGDTLPFVASINVANDQNQDNNTSIFTQIVVNSFDPNDIICHEGASITPEQAQKPLHYTIRFQNTGTAPAVNVRLENELADLLDWNTFRPVSASHSYTANRVGNQVTFTFPNINLVAEQDDEPASHGFVIYEIKPRSTADVGDSIDNTASIYFDFNQAIVTNTFSTVISLLKTPESRPEAFALYPNPAKGKFHIRTESSEIMDVEIFDARGSKVSAQEIMPNGDEASVDISGLNTGLYFVKIASQKGSVVRKLMVD